MEPGAQHTMFQGARKYEGASIEQWNVAGVSNLLYMFWNAPEFTGNLGGWDVSQANVTKAQDMFYGASKFDMESVAHWFYETPLTCPSDPNSGDVLGQNSNTAGPSCDVAQYLADRVDSDTPDSWSELFGNPSAIHDSCATNFGPNDDPDTRARATANETKCGLWMGLTALASVTDLENFQSTTADDGKGECPTTYDLKGGLEWESVLEWVSASFRAVATDLERIAIMADLQGSDIIATVDTAESSRYVRFKEWADNVRSEHGDDAAKAHREAAVTTNLAMSRARLLSFKLLSHVKHQQTPGAQATPGWKCQTLDAKPLVTNYYERDWSSLSALSSSGQLPWSDVAWDVKNTREFVQCALDFMSAAFEEDTRFCRQSLQGFADVMLGVWSSPGGAFPHSEHMWRHSALQKIVSLVECPFGSSANQSMAESLKLYKRQFTKAQFVCTVTPARCDDMNNDFCQVQKSDRVAWNDNFFQDHGYTSFELGHDACKEMAQASSSQMKCETETHGQCMWRNQGADGSCAVDDSALGRRVQSFTVLSAQSTGAAAAWNGLLSDFSHRTTARRSLRGSLLVSKSQRRLNEGPSCVAEISLPEAEQAKFEKLSEESRASICLWEEGAVAQAAQYCEGYSSTRASQEGPAPGTKWTDNARQRRASWPIEASFCKRVQTDSGFQIVVDTAARNAVIEDRRQLVTAAQSQSIYDPSRHGHAAGPAEEIADEDIAAEDAENAEATADAATAGDAGDAESTDDTATSGSQTEILSSGAPLRICNVPGLVLVLPVLLVHLLFL